MLTLQSNAGRIFVIDLAAVESIEYDGYGTLMFHTSHRTILIGSKNWGVPIAPKAAQQIIDKWVAHRQVEGVPPAPTAPVEIASETPVSHPQDNGDAKRRTKRLGRKKRSDRSR